MKDLSGSKKKVIRKRFIQSGSTENRHTDTNIHLHRERDDEGPTVFLYKTDRACKQINQFFSSSSSSSLTPHHPPRVRSSMPRYFFFLVGIFPPLVSLTTIWFIVYCRVGGWVAEYFFEEELSRVVLRLAKIEIQGCLEPKKRGLLRGNLKVICFQRR